MELKCRSMFLKLISDITYTLKLRRKTGEYLSQVIIPQYLFAFICIFSGIIPSSLPLPRLLIKFLMIILICGLKGAKHIPSNSVLALMIGNSFFIIKTKQLHQPLYFILLHLSICPSINPGRLFKGVETLICSFFTFYPAF